MEFPVLSGICGSLASYAGRTIIMYIGKIAFQDESQLMYRGVGLICMLLFNKWMFQFSFKSMQINGSSVTVLLQFIVGNLINVRMVYLSQGLNGYFLLSESLSLQWLIGIILMCFGVFMISNDNHERQKQQ
ncbi:unnamed protein product (macronuclear) [Paramecium tetraurelia]|uniref:EamA domain-containing protein n=1 Tax=Paramecium tetraurelia TaxID=5888 RepID=A0E1L3_PARTE|nr:uncharacterized protein GSPATT00022350001 [Paramecium tetraurelia]CAK89180.1 unnamed protein product [Paramecium tetraurelia]|eukprot:XP_001456577.1 hypothetical protein (macronuclear) [Paramecium tetraurelia strain d4-2]